METNKNNEDRKTSESAGQMGRENDDFNQNDWDENADTDKYLAMEQPGVSYTKESSPTMSSDYAEAEPGNSDKFRIAGENSRNSDAFSQDDYILRDNIDLDEDQNQSISSEDNDK